MKTLQIHCGAKALATLKQNGLRAADIALIPAAAGGPKGLALHGLDCALFGEWLPQAPRQRQLIGASVGAWRMAAAAHTEPVAALERLADFYCDQRYSRKPSATEISAFCARLVEHILDGRPQGILNNPHYRLNVLTVRGKKWLTQESAWRTSSGFAAAAASNAVARRHLGRWLDRAWFYDPRERPSLLPLNDFHTDEIALTLNNLHDALLASGAIPMILNPVTDIEGAPPGLFWDGGIIDYHLALPFERVDGLVLYPHFAPHITPGWLDKFFPARRASGASLENVILISPTPEFVASLPNKKLPDRSDFKRYGPDCQDERIRDWRIAVNVSKRMGEEFLQLAASGDIVANAKPFV